MRNSGSSRAMKEGWRWTVLLLQGAVPVAAVHSTYVFYVPDFCHPHWHKQHLYFFVNTASEFSVNTAFVFFMFLIFATITDIHSICIFCTHSHSICIFCKHLRSICIFCVPDFCHHYCSITDRESHPYIFIMMNLHPVNVAHCSARYYTVQISFSSLAKTMY